MKENANRDAVLEAAKKLKDILDEKATLREIDRAYRDGFYSTASSDAEAYRIAFRKFIIRLNADSMDELWDVFNPKKWKKDANYKEVVRIAVCTKGTVGDRCTGYHNINNLIPLTERLDWAVVEDFLRINDEMEFYSSDDDFIEFFVGAIESCFLARELLETELKNQENRRRLLLIGGIFLLIIIFSLVG
jgi:hypothetical protein